MKIIPYIIYLYLIAFHYTILSEIVDIYQITFDLAAVIVGLIAMYRSESVALWFALAAAVVAGSRNPELIPWEILLLGGTAVVVNQVSLRVNLESIASRLFIIGGLVFVHVLAVDLLVSRADVLFSIYRHILPTVLYSLVVLWILFLIIDKKLTWPKIKSLF